MIRLALLALAAFTLHGQVQTFNDGELNGSVRAKINASLLYLDSGKFSGAGTPGPPDNVHPSCVAPFGSKVEVYADTANHDQWWCAATNTWLKLLSVTNSGPYEVIGGTGAAPSNPPSGALACYFDSTTNTQVCIDSGGNPSSMVKGLALTVVGKGTGGTFTQVGSSTAGVAMVTVAGALTTDTAVCTETTPIQHGSTPHWVDYMSCQITAANTLKVYLEQHDVDDNIWSQPVNSQTFNFIVYR